MNAIPASSAEIDAAFAAFPVAEASFAIDLQGAGLPALRAAHNARRVFARAGNPESLALSEAWAIFDRISLFKGTIEDEEIIARNARA